MSTEFQANDQGVLDAAIEIGGRRADTLRQIKKLIQEGEDKQAWSLLLKHLGLNEKSNRTFKSVDGGAGR